MNNQSIDFRYFVDNHDELLKEYRNKFVVISDKKVCFSSSSFEEALSLALDNDMKLGTFIVQQCTEGDSAYTQTFHSRPVFA